MFGNPSTPPASQAPLKRGIESCPKSIHPACYGRHKSGGELKIYLAFGLRN